MLLPGLRLSSKKMGIPSKFCMDCKWTMTCRNNLNQLVKLNELLLIGWATGMSSITHHILTTVPLVFLQGLLLVGFWQ